MAETARFPAGERAREEIAADMGILYRTEEKGAAVARARIEGWSKS